MYLGCYLQAMNDTLTQNLIPLKRALSDILLARVEPISEFELIRLLQNPPYELLGEHALRGQLDLFQTHFLVFHCLYVLRHEWGQEGLGRLRIEPLAIALEPVAQACRDTSEVTKADPLASYYLDLDHLAQTKEQDVASLLGQFWQRFGQRQEVTADQRSQALVVMNLTAMPSCQAQLKRRFRHLIHQRHPDKGGSHEAMQELQWAYKILRQTLSYGIHSS